jgi:hypothetical protein
VTESKLLSWLTEEVWPTGNQRPIEKRTARQKLEQRALKKAKLMNTAKKLTIKDYWHIYKRIHHEMKDLEYVVPPEIIDMSFEAFQGRYSNESTPFEITNLSFQLEDENGSNNILIIFSDNESIGVNQIRQLEAIRIRTSNEAKLILLHPMKLTKKAKTTIDESDFIQSKMYEEYLDDVNEDLGNDENGGDGDGNEAQANTFIPLSKEGLQGYIKSVVDLHKTQVLMGINNNPTPRGDLVSRWLKTKQVNDTIIILDRIFASQEKSLYGARRAQFDGYV